MDLAKFQDKIDRQIAEAQDRRRFDRLGGQALRDIHLHDISRYELPKTVSRNAKDSNSSKNGGGDKRQFDLQKSKKYGDIALRLFKAEHAIKKNKEAAQYRQVSNNLAKNPLQVAPQRYNVRASDGDLSFETPPGKNRKPAPLSNKIVKSEVDFLLGYGGGRPSVMTTKPRDITLSQSN